MREIELVIKISEEDYERLKVYKKAPFCSFPSRVYEAVANGKPIPPGHGKIVDAKCVLENGDNWEVETALMQTEAIIEADKDYEVKVITRGNCRVCGKELTEGLFFCKECKAKIKSGEK